MDISVDLSAIQTEEVAHSLIKEELPDGSLIVRCGSLIVTTSIPVGSRRWSRLTYKPDGLHFSITAMPRNDWMMRRYTDSLPTTSVPQIRCVVQKVRKNAPGRPVALITNGIAAGHKGFRPYLYRDEGDRIQVGYMSQPEYHQCQKVTRLMGLMMAREILKDWPRDWEYATGKGKFWRAGHAPQKRPIRTVPRHEHDRKYRAARQG